MRITRSRSQKPPPDSSVAREESPQAAPSTQEPAIRSIVCTSQPLRLPHNLSRKDTRLGEAEHRLLGLKQAKLRDSQNQIAASVLQHTLSSPEGLAVPLAAAAAATLVFAQEEAGTAICVSAEGLLLTCAHCVGDTWKKASSGPSPWMLFASGNIVRAKCVAWDANRDLALLQIVACQTISAQGSLEESFPMIDVSETHPRIKAPLVCIGHPGSEDLEAATSGIATGYDVLHVSSGQFRGLEQRQDPQDNSDIGALKHSCWTYWGHSGAPLIEKQTGKLVGLHSSWDDQTGMRRGVPLVAIQAFLAEHRAMASSLAFPVDGTKALPKAPKAGSSKTEPIELD